MKFPGPALAQLSLRWRIVGLAVAVTAASCVVVGFAAYAIAQQILVSRTDAQLDTRAQTVATAYSATAGSLPPMFLGQVGMQSGLAIITADGRSLQAGAVPIGSSEQRVSTGTLGASLRTVRGYRVLARPISGSAPRATVVVSESLDDTNDTLNTLAGVLVAAGVALMVFAGIAGRFVASAGLRPVRRLDHATQYIAATESLAPIPVAGTDEIADLTRTFNIMLVSLAQSRSTQNHLIHSAATGLERPLAALRGNVEQLISTPYDHRTGADYDRLRATVIEQIEHITHTITALVNAGRPTLQAAIHSTTNFAVIGVPPIAAES